MSTGEMSTRRSRRTPTTPSRYGKDFIMEASNFNKKEPKETVDAHPKKSPRGSNTAEHVEQARKNKRQTSSKQTPETVTRTTRRGSKRLANLEESLQDGLSGKKKQKPSKGTENKKVNKTTEGAPAAPQEQTSKVGSSEESDPLSISPTPAVIKGLKDSIVTSKGGPSEDSDAVSISSTSSVFKALKEAIVTYRSTSAESGSKDQPAASVVRVQPPSLKTPTKKVDSVGESNSKDKPVIPVVMVQSPSKTQSSTTPSPNAQSSKTQSSTTPSPKTQSSKTQSSTTPSPKTQSSKTQSSTTPSPNAQSSKTQSSTTPLPKAQSSTTPLPKTPSPKTQSPAAPTTRIDSVSIPSKGSSNIVPSVTSSSIKQIHVNIIRSNQSGNVGLLGEQNQTLNSSPIKVIASSPREKQLPSNKGSKPALVTTDMVSKISLKGRTTWTQTSHNDLQVLTYLNKNRISKCAHKVMKVSSDKVSKPNFRTANNAHRTKHCQTASQFSDINFTILEAIGREEEMVNERSLSYAGEENSEVDKKIQWMLFGQDLETAMTDTRGGIPTNVVDKGQTEDKGKPNNAKISIESWSLALTVLNPNV